ncbi:MAG: hypothetical protein JSS81_29945 [Acidobacteria bacterium]|nr:hypothetical protein [Acidobacteriota bacterium]
MVHYPEDVNRFIESAAKDDPSGYAGKVCGRATVNLLDDEILPVLDSPLDILTTEKKPKWCK